MDLGLKGKSVIVTASSKGLGKAVAKTFAEEGAHVFISSRNETLLKSTAEEIIQATGNENIHYVTCDLTNHDSIKQLVERVVTLHGTVDCLVNNAGGPPAGGFEQFSDEQWQKAFELNLLSYIRMIREVLPWMKKKQNGRIVNIASSSIKQVIDNLILSNTFRAGIAGLSKSLSTELAKYNILINTVGPGRIATDRVRELDSIRANELNISLEEQVKKMESLIPMKRYGTPDEFAKVVVFLCSQANTYMTGQSLIIDGGMVKAL